MYKLKMCSKDQIEECLLKQTSRVIILGYVSQLYQGHSCLISCAELLLSKKTHLELLGSSLNIWSAGAPLLEGGHEESCGICQMHRTRWIWRGQGAEQVSLSLVKFTCSGFQQIQRGHSRDGRSQ